MEGLRGSPSPDWPLSRQEKLGRVLQLYRQEVDAANQLLQVSDKACCVTSHEGSHIAIKQAISPEPAALCCCHGQAEPAPEPRTRPSLEPRDLVATQAPAPLFQKDLPDGSNELLAGSDTPRSCDFTTPVSSPRECIAARSCPGFLQPGLICSAARHGRHREVEAALAAGFAPDYADAFGNTLFHMACQNGNKRIAKLVIKSGGNMDAQNERGNTGLHYLFAYGYTGVAEYFIGKGADEHVRNGAGFTAREGIR
eukprot:TRINITY_DN43029_c0_g1_i1.p1 TRINITY_DN43029_c0_g1~~TRINITY_DN43029_c0_g1_i1.p1  ORF type:complete len:254 (+),score=26.39 TRINITY_DN43029_c0_g1_i1:75-836(+)